MMLVLFEAVAKPHGADAYLDLAAQLKPEVDKIDGFLGIERFRSFADPAKLLSLSAWRDEAAIAQWRAHDQHRIAQHRGRTALFAHYRLRVAHVARDYGS